MGSSEDILLIADSCVRTNRTADKTVSGQLIKLQMDKLILMPGTTSAQLGLIILHDLHMHSER